MSKTCDLVSSPGGFIITEKAINFCQFKAGAKILDIGCGTGATVNYLKENFKIDSVGIDKKTANSLQENIMVAQAENIPFPTKAFDGVLMECSFSMTENQSLVLQECHRILKNNWQLIISDMYAHYESVQLDGCLGRIDKKEDIISIIEKNNFKVELFEDFSHLLKTMWGQMIFDKGAATFYSELGTCSETMKRIKCGYFLIVAKKQDII